MADNVAQSIKDLQKDLAALDKQLLSNNANWDKLGQTIVDSLKRGGLGLDDLFSKMKGQKDVIKLRAIIDRDALMDDVKKLQTAVDKGVKSVKVGGVEITGQKQIEQALEGYKAQLKLVPKTLAEAYDYAVKIANTLGGGNSSKASKEWLERTALNTKEKKALDDATNGYIKQTQAIQDLNRTLDELKQKRATAEALPVTGVGKSGILYKTDASKQSALGKIDKEITNVETKINNATTAAQKFQAQLIAMQGEKKTKAMSRALGVEEAESEVQKIPTVFDRVIAQINQRAAQSGEQFAKRIVNAQGVSAEAMNAARSLVQSYKTELDKLRTIKSANIFSIQEAAMRAAPAGDAFSFWGQLEMYRNLGRSASDRGLFANAVESQQRGTDITLEKMREALSRYQQTLQSIINLEEKREANQRKYAANVSAIEGVTRRYNDNEQALAKLQQRWEELNVKKQAGLVNQKDFDAQIKKILDEYDRLIAKRKEFEIGDLGQMSSNRQREREDAARKYAQEQAKLTREQERARLQAEREAARASAQSAKDRIAQIKRENKEQYNSIQEQIKLNRQLTSLTKQYQQLLRNTPQSQRKSNQDLKDAESQLRKLLALAKEYDKVSPGSRKIAAQYLEYEKINNKLKEINSKHKEQESNIVKLLPTLRRLASAFGVAFSVQGLVNFGKKLVETRGEFEMQFVAMKQIIGDVDAATKIWNQTMQQALQSPFKAMQLVDYTKKLAAYRIETDKLFDTTKRLADVSAGLGVDMGRLILAYGQVKTANYLRASEVRQFTEAGVNIYGELAKYFSEIEGRAVSTAEVVERTSKRMVLFSDVEAIFKRMTDEGGTFFNMQEVQSDTVRGQIMKLHDAYDQMLNTIGESNQGTIRDLVDTLNKLVRNWQDIAYIIKFNLSVFLPYIAATKIATLGMKKAGDASLWFSNKLIGQRVALSSTNEILKLNSATLGFWHRSLIRATKGVQAFVIGLKSIGRAVLPFAILEGIIFLTEKIFEAHRAAARLKEDLEGIKFGNSESLQSNIQGFERLKKAIEDSNDGSQERLRLIEQMNNKYGDYLPHLITEIDTVQQLNDAYDSVIQSMREYSYAKTKEQGEERIRKEMFEVYNDAVNDLFGTKSNRQVSYGKTGSFYLEKHEIQDILKQIQDELIKDPELNGQSLVQRLIANYTGIQEAHVDYAHIWAGYIEDMREQVKEMQNLERYAEEAVSPSYRSGEERSRAEELRKKAEAELAAANEAWAKEKDSLTHTIEDSVLKGIQDARKEEAKVDREEGESDAEYNMRLWNARVKADEDANKAIKQQHIITNFAIEEKEKEHQARLLKIRLSNQQISAESYNKQMLAIYPELDDRIKQYNDKIRAMIVGQFGEEWSGNADAITLFKQMRIGIDDISQGVAQYQKNFAGTVENQIKIVQDLYDWKERGYNIDENDLNVQREKLAVYVRMARLLGVKTDYNPIGNDLFADIQRQFNNKYGNKPIPYLPFGNTFFGLEEGDRMLSQIELLDKYTKKWQEYEKTYNTLVESKKNNKDLSEAAAAELDAQIEEAKKNKEASKFLIDLLGYIDKLTRGGGKKESASRLISLIKEMRSEYDKLSKSAYGYAKSEEKVRASFGNSWEAILKEAGVPKDFDFSTNAGEIAALERVRDYVKGNAKFAKDAWKDVQKVIDQLKTESEIEVQVRIREDFGRQMEEAFGNYELMLELQKLNIPDDVAKDLFPDFDAETLGDLQGRMRMFLKEQGENFDEDDLKKYEEWSKKVESEILKYRKDKAKQYSKYLEKEYSDRAKLQMQYAKDVAFVTANFKDEKQRDNIIKNIDKKFQDDLNELNWKSFKESDFYVEMMEDISSLPAEYTQMMLDKLNEILENPETLLPRALKEAINARQKVLEAQIATQPIKLMSTSVKEIRDAAKDLGGNGMLDTKKRVDEEIVSVQREINEYNELIVCLQNTQGEMKAYEDAVKSTEDAYGGLTLQTRRAIDMLGETHALGMFQHTMEENQKAIDEINEKEEEGGKLDSADRQRRAGLQAENDLLAAQIKLINDWIEAKRKEEEIRMRQVGTEAEYKRGQGETSSDVGEQITSTQEETDTRTKRVQELKQWQNAFLNFTKGWESWNGAVNNAIKKVSSMGNAVYDMYDALGGETDALTEGWKEFGNTLTQTITSTLTLIPQLVAGFVEAGTSINAAMGIVGLIAEAVQLVVTMIGAFAKLHDAHYEKEIENQQKKIDALRDAYARLERQIERTWSSVSYMQTYEQQVQNIREQISAMEAQMAAEREKKNTDDNAVRQYQRDIQDAYDQLEELEQKSIEVFGGIGEEGYRSAAEGFVDAWKSAFLETGDGLQGLQDHFDEFLQDWFVKQATMRIAGGMLEPVFRQIDAAVDKYGEGGTSAMLSEIERVRDMAAAIFPDLSLALEDLAGIFGVGGEGSLSGLAAGIQGMTEEQANILEAYWNSVRMYAASIDTNVSRIAEMLGAGGPNTNPMLTELETIASHTRYIPQIYTLLTGTRRNLGNGQGFVTYNQ